MNPSELAFARICGYRIYSCAWMTKRRQVRFPQSKKRRIRKKWERDYRNWSVIGDGNILQIEQRLYAHPDTIKLIERKGLKGE